LIKIGLLGCGTVGSGVVELIGKDCCNKQLSVQKILVKNLNKHINSPYRMKLTDRFEDIQSEEIDIVVEVIGGIDPAYFYVKQSLLQGRHVVTANKDLIARHGSELQKIAYEKGVRLLYEASVGGGIPIIKPLNESLAANNITGIWGIVNGTTNYMLSQMYSWGKDFSEALREAQANGYAEANPEADVDGYDAARKLAILSSIAYRSNVSVENIHTEGIRNISPDDIELSKYLGYTIKLMAISKNMGEKLMARVSPVMLKNTHPLSQVGDVYNAIIIKGDAVGDVLFYGKGAGKLPTASAVLGDVIDIVKNNIGKNNRDHIRYGGLPEARIDNADSRCRFFVRLRPNNRSAAMGLIAKAFDSFEFVFPDKNKLSRPIDENQIVFITSAMTEQGLRQSISCLASHPDIDSILSVIRIEEVD
jgi:homoserine dehydrogenase